MSKKRKDVTIKVTTKGTFNGQAMAEQIANIVKRDLSGGKTGKSESKKTWKTNISGDNKE